MKGRRGQPPIRRKKRGQTPTQEKVPEQRLKMILAPAPS
jgi:hypothetical protein